MGLPLAAVLLVPGFLRRMLRRGGHRAHFGQRFGSFTPEETSRLQAHTWTWIRSISVGETLVALKLAKALRSASPQIRIALSVTTSTGYALAEKEASDWLFVFYNPVDSRRVVRKVLDLLNPGRLVLVEGELWPNLLDACLQRDIPVMLANARLSPRSAGRFAKARTWTAPFFKLLRWVGVPDSEDRPRWESVGVPGERLVLTGSIKFDQEAAGLPDAAPLRALLRHPELPENAPLLVAGSTHDGEEAWLVSRLPVWRQKHPSLRLLIAPRHVERVPELLQELAPLGAKIQRRTALPAGGPWDVLLLDTTGELRAWYALATVAFVGKSLTAHGGQNPVEPALAGKPVVFGPHMENFEAVVRLLLQAGGAVQAGTPGELEAVLCALLDDPERRHTLGQHALGALQVHQGAARKTAELVLQTPARV
jgi:3-deoxy-D-manno-octulosonic-acid transferase